MISIEKLKNDGKERQKKKNLHKQKQEELQKEDPEVEYKKRLVERFSYKNTDLIKKIYAENRVSISKKIEGSACNLASLLM